MTTETGGNIQTLHLGKNEPINIVTPLGVIRLDRNDKDHRKIDFTFPPIEGFKAFKGNKPEVTSLPLVSEADGHANAQFDMLVPIRDSDGNTVAVGTPKLFRLVETERENLSRISDESLSGVQGGDSGGGSDDLQPVSEVRSDGGSDCLGQPVETAC